MKRQRKTLSLNKETIRNLTAKELSDVGGGTLPSMPPPTFLCGIIHNSLKYCASVHTTTFGRGCNEATKHVTQGCYSSMC